MLPPSGQISKTCRTYCRRGAANNKREGLWKEAAARATAPWLSRSVAGISPQKPGFDPRPVRVEFVVDKVAMGQSPLPQRYFDFSCQYHSTNALYSSSHLSPKLCYVRK